MRITFASIFIVLLALAFFAGCEKNPGAVNLEPEKESSARADASLPPIEDFIPPDTEASAALKQESDQIQDAERKRRRTYLIGPEDVLRVKVWMREDLSKEGSVRDDGQFFVPLAGNVRAAGLTVAEFQKSLTEKLTEFIRFPQVDVEILEYKSKVYYLLGQVRDPGMYPIKGTTTLLEAVSQGHGFSDSANLGGACLNNPILITQMTEWLDAAAATGAQSVFWDEPHWSPGGSPRNPDGEHCVCDFCLEKAGSQGITESFRAKSLVLFLARMVSLATDRGMKSSICVMPQGMAGQPGLDWHEIAALPGLSEFGTDPYWQAFNIREAVQRDRFIDKNSTAAREVSTAAGVESMLWTQAFRVKAGDEDDLLDGSKRIMNHNPDTIAIWGFEACAHMSTLACADTDKIWHGLIDIYKGINK